MMTPLDLMKAYFNGYVRIISIVFSLQINSTLLWCHYVRIFYKKIFCQCLMQEIQILDAEPVLCGSLQMFFLMFLVRFY